MADLFASIFCHNSENPKLNHDPWACAWPICVRSGNNMPITINNASLLGFRIGGEVRCVAGFLHGVHGDIPEYNELAHTSTIHVGL